MAKSILDRLNDPSLIETIEGYLDYKDHVEAENEMRGGQTYDEYHGTDEDGELSDDPAVRDRVRHRKMLEDAWRNRGPVDDEGESDEGDELGRELDEVAPIRGQRSAAGDDTIAGGAGDDTLAGDSILDRLNRVDAILSGKDDGKPAAPPKRTLAEIEEVGNKVGDKRRLTDEDKLTLLRAQRDDPSWTGEHEDELQREITAIEGRGRRTQDRLDASGGQRATRTGTILDRLNQVDTVLRGGETAAPTPIGKMPPALTEEDRLRTEQPARAIMTRRGGVQIQRPDPNAETGEFPNADYFGEKGVVTNMLPGAVASGKEGVANFIVGLAEEGRTAYARELRTGLSKEQEAAGTFARSAIRGRAVAGGRDAADADVSGQHQVAPTGERAAVLRERLAEATEIGNDFRAMAKQFHKEVELVTPRDMDDFQKALWSAAVSAPPTLMGIGLGIATRNPWLAMGVAGGGGSALQAGHTYGEAMEKLLKAGLPQEEAHRVAWNASLIDGMLEGVGEAIPLAAALKPGSPFLTRLFNTGWQESGQEGITQLLQDLNAYLSYKPEITLEEALNNTKIAMMAGAIGGAVYGTMGHAVELSPQAQIAREIESGVRDARWAQSAEDVAAQQIQREAMPRPVGRERPAAPPQEPGAAIPGRDRGPTPLPAGGAQEPPEEPSAILTPEARAERQERERAMTHRLEDGTLVEPLVENGKPQWGFWVDAAGTTHEAPRADPLQSEPNAEWQTGGTTYPVEVVGKGGESGTARLADGQSIAINLLKLDDEAKELLGLLPPEDKKKPDAKPATPSAEAAPAAPQQKGPAEPTAAAGTSSSSPARPEAKAGPPKLPIREVRQANVEAMKMPSLRAAVDAAVESQRAKGRRNVDQVQIGVVHDSEGRVYGWGSLMKLPQDVYDKVYSREYDYSEVVVNADDLDVRSVVPKATSNTQRLADVLVPELSKKEAKRRARLKRKADDAKAIDHDNDGIVDALIKLGGIDIDSRMEVVGDTTINPRIPWVGTLFQRGGRKIDELALALEENAFISPEVRANRNDNDGFNWIVEAIRAELQGEKTHSISRSDAAMAEKDREAYEQEKLREAEEEAAELAEEASEASDGAVEPSGAVEMGDFSSEGIEPSGIRVAIAEAAARLPKSVADELFAIYEDEVELLDALLTEVQNAEERGLDAGSAEDRGQGKDAPNKAAQERGEYRAGREKSAPAEESVGKRRSTADADRADQGAEKGTVRQEARARVARTDHVDGGRWVAEPPIGKPAWTMEWGEPSRAEIDGEVVATVVRLGNNKYEAEIPGWLWDNGEPKMVFHDVRFAMSAVDRVFREATAAALGEEIEATPLSIRKESKIERVKAQRAEAAEQRKERAEARLRERAGVRDADAKGTAARQRLKSLPPESVNEGQWIEGLDWYVGVVNAARFLIWKNYREEVHPGSEPVELPPFTLISPVGAVIEHFDTLEAAQARAASITLEEQRAAEAEIERRKDNRPNKNKGRLEQPRASYGESSDAEEVTRLLRMLDGIIASYRRIGADRNVALLEQLRRQFEQVRDGNGVFYRPRVAADRAWLKALHHNVKLHANGFEVENPFFVHDRKGITGERAYATLSPYSPEYRNEMKRKFGDRFEEEIQKVLDEIDRARSDRTRARSPKRVEAVLRKAQKSGEFTDLRWRIEEPGEDSLYPVERTTVVLENIESTTPETGAGRKLLQQIQAAGADVIPEDVQPESYAFWEKMADEGLVLGQYFLEEEEDADGAAGPRQLADIEVTLQVTEAETGRTVEIQQRADEALAEIDEKLDLAKRLLACLHS